MPHTPTDETRQLVKFAAAVGTRYEVIARQLGICDDTLKKYYRDELDLGRDQANQAIASSLYQKALDGDTTAMIFWLKTRARWRDTQALEVSGPDGGPMNTRIEVVYTTDPTGAPSLPSGPDSGPSDSEAF